MARFGEEYRTYRSRVPMFFPRRREWRRVIAATRATTAAGEVPNHVSRH